jgi:hypothetical protein
MANNVYKKQSTFQMYYTMHYAPFLKNGATRCLTEPYYQALLRILVPYIQTDMNVLDLRCALGRMSFELAKRTRDSDRH